MSCFRRPWVLVLLMLGCCALVWAGSLARYVNARYGYGIDIPAGFVVEPEADNGDGCKMHPVGGGVELLVYGSNNVQGLDLQGVYAEALEGIPAQPAYHKTGKNWFVISWAEGSTLHYRKTFVGPGSTNSFWFRYPEKRRATCDALTVRLEGSFRPGDLSRSH